MGNIEAANLVEQHLTEFVCYSAAPSLSIVIVFGLLAPKYRHMSRWLRSIFVVLAITGPIWSALGFLLLFYSGHFTRQGRHYLFQWQSQLTGIAIGLLISLFLSPEFRKLSRIPSLFRRRASLGQEDLTNR
jgi:membrane associated rhomboid family serine protease